MNEFLRIVSGYFKCPKQHTIIFRQFTSLYVLKCPHGTQFFVHNFLNWGSHLSFCRPLIKIFIGPAFSSPIGIAYISNGGHLLPMLLADHFIFHAGPHAGLEHPKGLEEEPVSRYESGHTSV
jgi:hypothetical protein